jgi:hypothetical protein
MSCPFPAAPLVVLLLLLEPGPGPTGAITPTPTRPALLLLLFELFIGVWTGQSTITGGGPPGAISPFGSIFGISTPFLTIISSPVKKAQMRESLNEPFASSKGSDRHNSLIVLVLTCPQYVFRGGRVLKSAFLSQCNS